MTSNLNNSSSFYQQLDTVWQEQNSLLCVGLDPDLSCFPHLFNINSNEEVDSTNKEKIHTAMFEFCKTIVDYTVDLVCAFKPQIAYFSSVGAEKVLEDIIQYIHQTYPSIPVILDAKRGDIGTTANQYAKEAFVRYQADSLTLNPYMGYDSIEPYLEYDNKGLFLLCRTSNEGGNDLQNLESDFIPIYQHVAKLTKQWNKQQNLGLVVGATYPQEMAKIRRIVGDEIPFLVPGIGAQGGNINAVVKAGANQDKTGLVISVSRAILRASLEDDFADQARNSALNFRDFINEARSRL